MTTVPHQITAMKSESHRPHAIVMAIVVAVAIAAALTFVSARPASTPSGAVPSAPLHDAITTDTRTIDAAVIPQSHGCIELDSPPAKVAAALTFLSDNLI